MQQGGNGWARGKKKVGQRIEKSGMAARVRDQPGQDGVGQVDGQVREVYKQGKTRARKMWGKRRHQDEPTGHDGQK